MPIYSSEVAAQIGMYQQQHANSQAYASGLTGMMSMQGPTSVQAEKLSGGAISMAGALGAPILGLGLGMAGLDPMSMGMKGFSAARGMGMGVVGAGAAGLGAAGLMMGGTAIAGYGVSQMYQGAQQQQQFNQDMRSSFNFLTPQGRGFTTGQLGVIGNQIRGMSGQVGSMGEMANFQELSGLAANMGKMGMANGVRDVQEFSRKFREMVTTLKTVATEMGTSLSAAQEFVVGMKGSGIFQKADQTKAAQQMRGYSMSGTVAVSELGAMGNIGSQISRSVGGRGRQGFFAGMKTLGMVGAAMDAGTLNEEDIYNATGLTGAEGRQAYATSQLSDSARFLRSGKGRYFLASVAGKDGSLDANSVQEWMSGDVGVGRTKGMAGSNLRKVGRANFIRNEGRLRGAAMEQFGGQLPMMALMGWANERGVDINTMNDREMLFASRQLGMGMDSLEGLVKQVRDLPKAQEAMRRSQESDTFIRAEAGRKATQGIEGAKKKIEHTREHIQAALQQVGASLYTDLTTMIESSINKMTNTYVEQASPNLAKAVSSARRGDAAAASKLMGLNPTAGRAFDRGLTAMGEGNRGPGGASAAAQFTNKGFMGLGTSDLDRVKEAGFGQAFQGFTMGGGTDNDKLRSSLQKMEGFKRGTRAGGDAGGDYLGSKYKDLINEVYAGDVGKQKGMDRATALMNALQENEGFRGDKEAQRLIAEGHYGADAERRGKFLSSIEKTAGIAAEARTSQEASPTMFSRAGGKYTSLDQATKETGAALLGEGRMGQGIEGKSRIAGAVGGAWAGMALGPVGMVAGGLAGYFGGGVAGKTVDKYQGKLTSDDARETGEWMRSEKGMGALQTLFKGSEKEREALTAQFQKEEQALQARIGRGEKGLEAELAGKKAMRGIDAYMSGVERGASREELDALSKKHGFKGADDAHKAAKTAHQTVKDQEDTNTRSTAGAVGAEARGKMGDFSSAGLVDEEGNIKDDALDKLGVNDAAKKALKGIITDTKTASQLGVAGADTDEEREKLKGLIGEGGSMAKNKASLADMSVKDLRDTAQKFREAGLGGMANELSESAGYRSRAERSLKTQGNIGLAGVLGVGPDLKTEEGRRKAWSLQGIKDPKALANVLATDMGLSNVSVDSAKKDADAAAAAVGDEKSAGYADRKALADRMKGRLKDAEASDPLRQKLQEITAEKDPTKKAAMLEKFQKSDEMQKFQLQQEEKKRAAEDKNNPVVRAIKEQKEMFDGIKDAIKGLPAGIGEVVSSLIPAGKGADGGYKWPWE